MKRLLLAVLVTVTLGSCGNSESESRGFYDTDKWLSEAAPPVVVLSKYYDGTCTWTKLLDGGGVYYTTYDRSLYSAQVGDTLKY